jgi:tetratricopeptide (TPR) repeat protein
MVFLNVSTPLEELVVIGKFVSKKEINFIKTQAYCLKTPKGMQPKKIVKLLSEKLNPLVNTNKNCLDLSLAYLCVGEHLNLPLYGVNLPDHFLIRWDNGKDKFNFETKNKIFQTDELYAKAYNLQDTSIYLKSLSKSELVSCMYVNISTKLMDQNNYHSAEKTCKSAIKLNPANLEAMYNLAKIRLREQDYVVAESLAKDALAMAKADPRFLQLMGDLYKEQNKFREAISFYRQSADAEYNLFRKIESLEKSAKCNIALDDLSSAKQNYLSILSINPNMREAQINIKTIEQNL